jgi:Cu+-exporting ATPase
MSKTDSTSQKRTVVKIGGMNCAGCVSAIQKHVSNIPGVEKCDVNLGAGKAIMQYDPSKVNLDILEKAVEDVGYKVVYEKLKLTVSGISDASDAQRLENRLAKKEGVRFSSVNFGTEQILMEYNPALLSLSDIRKYVADSGFKILSEDLSTSAEVETKKIKRLFISGLIFSIPVILLG